MRRPEIQLWTNQNKGKSYDTDDCCFEHWKLKHVETEDVRNLISSVGIYESSLRHVAKRSEIGAKLKDGLDLDGFGLSLIIRFRTPVYSEGIC